jgi:hypothetical protein
VKPRRCPDCPARFESFNGLTPAALPIRSALLLQHEARPTTQRDQTGTPWLRDLSSSHGTAIEPQKHLPRLMPSGDPNRSVKQGRRGVTLYPEVLQFGASHACFVSGTNRVERGAVNKGGDIGDVTFRFDRFDRNIQHNNQRQANGRQSHNHLSRKRNFVGIDMGDPELKVITETS